MKNAYEDLMNLPRPISKNHRPMPLRDRAAQFAPFAALSGYGAAIDETARLVDEKEELSEERLAILNRKLQTVLDRISDCPIVTLTRFVPDERKVGGAYVTETRTVKTFEPVERILHFAEGDSLSLENLYDIAIQVSE